MAAGSRYGISLKQLRDLMEFRGKEGVDKINNLHGGVHEIAKKLQSSETTGMPQKLIQRSLIAERRSMLFRL